MLFYGSVYAGTTMGYGKVKEEEPFKFEYKLPENIGTEVNEENRE